MKADFRILGPLEVRVDGVSLPLGGAKQRALLGVLLVHLGEAVSADRLIDQLWGESPPPTARNTLQVHLSRLRRLLATSNGDSPILVRNDHGYFLAIDPEQLDARRFVGLISEGRAALADGDARGAAEKLTEALALWRGPALADLAYAEFAQTEIAQLEELRLEATETRIEAELARGGSSDLVPELEALIHRHPLRERLRGQLMLALYRAGRQADALAAYRDARRALTEELGLEPSASLKALERAILEHDPALVARPARATPQTPPHRRLARRRTLALVAALAVAAAGAVFVGRADEDAPAGIASNSLGLIDPASDRIIAEVSLASRPGAVAVGRGSVWVAGPDTRVIWRVNPKTRSVERTIRVGLAADAIAVGAGGVWAAGALSNVIVRLDPETGTVTRIRAGPPGQLPACFGESFQAGEERYAIPELAGKYPFRGTPQIDLGVARQLVWYLCSAGALLRVDPTTNEAVRVEYPADRPQALAHGFGALWVANADGVARVDDVLGAIRRTVGLFGTPNGLAVGAGSVWVSTEQLAALWRVRLIRRSDLFERGVDKVVLPERPRHLAFGEGALWVLTTDGNLVRVDPVNNQVAASIPIGSPQGIAVGEGGVWVTAQASR